MHGLVNNRYAVVTSEPVRKGGLAEVFACADLERGGERVALKLLKDLPDKDETLQLLFDREVSALRELKHPNVVSLRDAGTDDTSGRFYVALEWVEHTLDKWLGARQELTVEEFTDQIALPILAALAFAHERKVVHRDVKPSNILITSEGVPKLADFGISKLIHILVDDKATLADFGSKPFVPPEVESKSSFSRDVFAFGVTILTCLSSEPVDSSNDFPRALDGLAASAGFRDLLESCVSLDPSDRPRTASDFYLRLATLRQIERRRHTPTRTVHLELTKGLNTRIADEEGLAEASVPAFVLAELQDSPSLRPLLEDHESSTVFDGPFMGEKRHFFLYGNNWSFRIVAEGDRPVLTIIGAARVGELEADNRRDRHLILKGYRFSLDAPLNYQEARSVIAGLVEESYAAEAQREAQSRANERARVFEQWNRQIDAREAAEEEREERFAVEYIDRDGYAVRLRATDTPPQGIEGTQRVLLDSGGRYISRGAIDLVDGEYITLYLDRLPSRGLKQAGFMAFDTGASRSKIHRERDALARVRFGSSGLASASLPDLLLEPSNARASEPDHVDDWLQPGLDDHKRAAVEYALGNSDFTVVHGPPGTGKTTFIAELVGQELRRNPAARILLASQTHVAVDNALAQIRKVVPTFRLLRVGSRAEEKISAEVVDLVVRNQLRGWRDEVRQRSNSYLEEAVATWGYDVKLVRRSHLLTELARSVRRVHLCEAGIARRLSELRGEAENDTSETLSDEAREAVSKEIERLRDGRKEEERQIALLLTAEDLRDERLLKEEHLDSDDLLERANALLPTGDDQTVDVRDLLAEQTRWLQRIASGADFEAALLVASSLVAGTCVGVAGAEGIDDSPFDLCVIDEASKATPTETLVPMVRSRRWVLVGDEKQLPPFLDEALQSRAVQDEFGLDPKELRQTIFGRLARGLPETGSRSLNRQYRMVPAIGDLISVCFYGGKLESDPKSELAFTAAVQAKPVCWYATDALPNRREKFVKQAETYVNLGEAREVMKYLRRLGSISAAADRTLHVLVLAPYSGQVRELSNRVRSSYDQLAGLDVEVNTVDAAQGREADVLVFSAVRSNARGRLGFVRELERTNVALSRGKYLLAIFGDSSFFENVGGPLADVARYIRHHPSTATLTVLSQ